MNWTNFMLWTLSCTVAMNSWTLYRDSTFLELVAERLKEIRLAVEARPPVSISAIDAPEGYGPPGLRTGELTNCSKVKK